MTHESKGPRFSGRCPCGHNLELAYNEHLKKAFFNCFRCFPMFKNLAETGKCACGRKLELAINRETDTAFYNCFKCFPFAGIERLKDCRTKRIYTMKGAEQ